MTKKWISVILLSSLLGTGLKTSYGGSFYNSRGLGEFKYFSNALAMGMGGSLIAVPDRFQINLLNPAGLVFIPVTRFGGDFLHEAVWNKTNIDAGFSKYTNLNGISLAIPVKSNQLVTALGIVPTSQFDYDYATTGVIDNFGYTKKIIATGGLNRVSWGWGYAITNYLYLGSFFHYNFGKLEQTWKVDYLSDLFWDSSDNLTRKMWGLNWSLGFIFRPMSKMYIGGLYSGAYDLNYQDHIKNLTQKGSFSYEVDAFKLEQKKMAIPETWGLGITYVLKEKFNVSSDFIYQPWSRSGEKKAQPDAFHDFYHNSLGVEMLPSKNILAKYWEKMTYRLGYFYNQISFKDETGTAVTEYGVTIGSGLPYYGSLGRIDIALRFGKRGDIGSNHVEENIFQLFLSIIGGEKWFVRGY